MSKANVFLGGLLICASLAFSTHGQGCALVMQPEYDDYVNVGVTGTTIYTTVQVLGYTIFQPSAGCNAGSVKHQGRVFNKISSTGGWVYGPQVPPANYINVTNYQTFTGTAGASYPFSWTAEVYCTMAGAFFYDSGSFNVPVPTISGPDTVWYFGGQSTQGYATSITLTSTAGSGSWSITSGGSRISLSTTSGATTTLSPSGSHFSTTIGDTCVAVTVSGVTSSPFCLTVRTPWKLEPSPKNYSVTDQMPGYGYQTTLSYDLYDNFDTVMIYAVGWNEVVGTATNENGSNWATCCGTLGAVGGLTAPLQDILTPPGLNNPTSPSPTPVYHNPPSGQTIYRLVPQSIRVGSSDEPGGQGILVQTDSLAYWIDHGSHESIVIPPKPPE